MYKKLKYKIFETIQPSVRKGLNSGRLFEFFIMTLILMSVASVFISTFSLSEEFLDVLWKFEIIVVSIFSVEYILRIWTADFLYPDLPPVASSITLYPFRHGIDRFDCNSAFLSSNDNPFQSFGT